MSDLVFINEFVYKRFSNEILSLFICCFLLNILVVVKFRIFKRIVRKIIDVNFSILVLSRLYLFELK